MGGLVPKVWVLLKVNARDAIVVYETKFSRENLSCVIIVRWKGVYGGRTANYCRALIFNPVDAILTAPLLEPESQNYANDLIFLCTDEKDFYVNGAELFYA